MRCKTCGRFIKDGCTFCNGNGCKGYWSGNPIDGQEFDCEYNPSFECEQCIYGPLSAFGKYQLKDPASKSNQYKYRLGR